MKNNFLFTINNLSVNKVRTGENNGYSGTGNDHADRYSGEW